MFSSFSALQRSFVMAAKPLHQAVEKGMQSSIIRGRTSKTESPMIESFEIYTQYLNEQNDKRERLVKISRDITMNSKKVIFQVHRITKSNREEVLKKAEKDLDDVTLHHVSRLIKELKGSDFWKLRRAYSLGVQEYIEASTFCKFCRTGSLMNLDEINAILLRLNDDPKLEPLHISALDYLLGVGDLTGELMRLAMGRISEGEVEFAENICSFVREIYRQLTVLAPNMYDCMDMKIKMDTMLQSVMKIEYACFSVRVRGSEFIHSSDYRVLGVPLDL